MKPIATLDIEASGLHPSSYPIEIGVLLANGDCYCSLIKPDSSWTHWCEKAEDLHRINRATLEEHGNSVRQVATELNQLLAGVEVYSDCWVLDNDWLIKLFHKAQITPRFTLRDIMYALNEDEYHCLEAAKQDIVEEIKIDRHRATNDARLLQLAYKRVKY
ncbi:MAG: hypothetical protein KTR20_11545 [Cellvibrionaceae bacterium]|nr:hypothetical protein [Cellvibrionaceae bacterium]